MITEEYAKFMETRILSEAKHIIATDDTVRETAAKLGSTKSTVQRDMAEKLPEIDPELSRQIKDIHQRHLMERPERRRKYYLEKRMVTD